MAGVFFLFYGGSVIVTMGCRTACRVTTTCRQHSKNKLENGLLLSGAQQHTQNTQFMTRGPLRHDIRCGFVCFPRLLRLLFDRRVRVLFYVFFFFFVSRKTSADAREEKRIAKRLKAIADAARWPPGRGRAPDHGAGAPSDGEGQGALWSATSPFNGRILDIGCGDGTLMPHLLDQGTSKKPKARKGGKKRKGEELQRAQPEAPATGRAGARMGRSSYSELCGVGASRVGFLWIALRLYALSLSGKTYPGLCIATLGPCREEVAADYRGARTFIILVVCWYRSKVTSGEYMQ